MVKLENIKKLDNEVKKVIKNTFSLIIMQLGNYIVPLVLLPFLILNLGVSGFGVLSISLALNSFFRAITSYGFDFTGSKQISENKDELKHVNTIFTRIMATKIVLFVLCIIALLCLSKLNIHHQYNVRLSFMYLIVTLSELLFPMWVYQGLQDMGKISIFKLISRVSYVIIIVCLVKSRDDIYLIPLVEGAVGMFFSLIAIVSLKCKYGIKLTGITCKCIFFELKNSWFIFMSKVSVLFYTSFNVLLLGYMTSPVIVGQYAVAEKIYMAIREVLNPLTQASFPYLVRKYKEEGYQYLKSVRFLMLFFMVILIFVSILTWFLSYEVIQYFAKGNVKVVVEIFQVFNVSIPLALGGLLSSLLIVKSENGKLYSITSLTMILNIVLVFPMIYYYQALGVAYCFLLVQFFHVTLQLIANKELICD